MRVVKIETCPWCGGAGHMVIEPMWRGSHGYHGCYSWEVQCTQCGATTPNGKFDNIYISQEEAEYKALEKWNKRKE
ncbi:MAG: Lar family restriction alleviation protein [Methanobrevibacter sp.]|nr:Lar family restriction alleviation protein [Methanobrevibacter sp.]